MSRSVRAALSAIAILWNLSGFSILVFAQESPAILSGSDLTHVVPVDFYFAGQSAPTQVRNSAAARLAANRLAIAGLVDTSGYSSEVKGKYEGFLITDSSIMVEGSELVTGAYGFGFSSDGKMNIFDISGKQIMSVASHKDDGLKHPRPLMMTLNSPGVRLYDGRFYVTLALK
jgi:hypothetical protein